MITMATEKHRLMEVEAYLHPSGSCLDTGFFTLTEFLHQYNSLTNQVLLS